MSRDELDQMIVEYLAEDAPNEASSLEGTHWVDRQVLGVWAKFADTSPGGAMDRAVRARLDVLERNLAAFDAQRCATLAGLKFDRWLAVLPARMVPRRVLTEVIGDGLERIYAVVFRGGSRWMVGLVYLSVVMVVLLEIARFGVRAATGKRSSR